MKQDYKVEDGRSTYQVRRALEHYLGDVQTATAEMIVEALGLESSGLDYLEVFRVEGWLSKRRSTGRDGGYIWYLKKAIPPTLLQQRPERKKKATPPPPKEKKTMVLDEVRARLEQEGPLTPEQIHEPLDVTYGAVRLRLSEWSKRGYISLKGVYGVCWFACLPSHEQRANELIRKAVAAKRGLSENSTGIQRAPRTVPTYARPPRRRLPAKLSGQEQAAQINLEKERARAAKLLQASGQRASGQADSSLSQEAANSIEVDQELVQALRRCLDQLAGKVRSHRELSRMVLRSSREVFHALQLMETQEQAEARQDGWVAPGAPLDTVIIRASQGWTSWSNKSGGVLAELVVTFEDGCHIYVDRRTGKKWHSLSDARTELTAQAS